MDSVDIQYRLRRLGYTQTQIAKDLNLSHGQVGNVIHGRATSKRVVAYIAKLIDCNPEDITSKANNHLTKENKEIHT